MLLGSFPCGEPTLSPRRLRYLPVMWRGEKGGATERPAEYEYYFVLGNTPECEGTDWDVKNAEGENIMSRKPGCAKNRKGVSHQPAVVNDPSAIQVAPPWSSKGSLTVPASRALRPLNHPHSVQLHSTGYDIFVQWLAVAVRFRISSRHVRACSQIAPRKGSRITVYVFFSLAHRPHQIATHCVPFDNYSYRLPDAS